MVALPLVVSVYGIAGAVCVIAASKLVRYVPLWRSQRRGHLPFTRQDLLFTLSFFAMFGIWQSLLRVLGATQEFGNL